MRQRFIIIRFLGEVPDRALRIETVTSDETLLVVIDLAGHGHYFPLRNIKEWFFEDREVQQ